MLLTIGLHLQGHQEVAKMSDAAERSLFAKMSGNMNEPLMIKYLEQVVAPHLDGRLGLLLLDSYAAHFTPNVLAKMNMLNIQHLVIPGETTSILQPLDVSINRPLKDAYRAAWND